MKRLILSCIFTAITLCISAHTEQFGSERKFKQEFLDRINSVRSQGCTCGTTYMPPVSPLVWNDLLQKSAEGHAWYMSNNHYFSHTSKDGRTMKDRIVAVGYNMNGYKSFMIGENIAAGQESIEEVMDGWLKSEGHCKNLMNPKFKEIGVAENHHYWVQDFGAREPFSAEQQRLIRSGRLRIIQGPTASSH